MSKLATLDSAQQPVFFPAGQETVFGIFTRPVPDCLDIAVLISSGGLTGTSTVGRNQMFVRMAQRLAADGLPSLRFDYHGIGESTGVLEEFRLDVTQPFSDDIVGAAACLAGQGHHRSILLGKCFGSRMALSSAALLEGLEGVVLIGPPVRDFGKGERAVTRLAHEVGFLAGVRRVLRPDFLRRLGDRRHRKTVVMAAKAKVRTLSRHLPGRPIQAGRDEAEGASKRFLDPLEALLQRGIPVQLVYGREDAFYREFQRASAHGRLARMLQTYDGLLDVTLTPGQVRGFVQCDVQDAIIDAACSWIRQRAGEQTVAAGEQS